MGDAEMGARPAVGVRAAVGVRGDLLGRHAPGRHPDSGKRGAPVVAGGEGGKPPFIKRGDPLVAGLRRRCRGLVDIAIDQGLGGGVVLPPEVAGHAGVLAGRRRRLVGGVRPLEGEREAGGVPRHRDHRLHADDGAPLPLGGV